MKTFDSYLFWEEDYKPLEHEFLEYLKYVPLTKDHEKVWSLKLANQLLLIGSSIDSFFKCAKASLRANLIDYYLNSIMYNGIAYTADDFESESEFNAKLLNDAKPNMAIYRSIFQDYYYLSDKSVYVLRINQEIKPFDEWGEGKSPEWWRIYRDLKHSRFENKKEATLKIVLEALSALFLLNIYHIDNRSYLINNKTIRSNLNLNSTEFINSRKIIDTSEPIIAKTRLFGYVWETKSFLKNRPYEILDPGNVLGI